MPKNRYTAMPVKRIDNPANGETEWWVIDTRHVDERVGGKSRVGIFDSEAEAQAEAKRLNNLIEG